MRGCRAGVSCQGDGLCNLIPLRILLLNLNSWPHGFHSNLCYDPPCIKSFRIKCWPTVHGIFTGGSRGFEWAFVSGLSREHIPSPFISSNENSAGFLLFGGFREREMCPVVYETFNKVCFIIQRRRLNRQCRMPTVRILSLQSYLLSVPPLPSHRRPP